MNACSGCSQGYFSVFSKVQIHITKIRATAKDKDDEGLACGRNENVKNGLHHEQP